MQYFQQKVECTLHAITWCVLPSDLPEKKHILSQVRNRRLSMSSPCFCWTRCYCWFEAFCFSSVFFFLTHIVLLALFLHVTCLYLAEWWRNVISNLSPSSREDISTEMFGCSSMCWNPLSTSLIHWYPVPALSPGHWGPFCWVYGVYTWHKQHRSQFIFVVPWLSLVVELEEGCLLSQFQYGDVLIS